MKVVGRFQRRGSFDGDSLPDEGLIACRFDDLIITDTAAEKAQDMAEVGITMHAWEYRAKWYGEEEKVAKARARGLGKKSPPIEQRGN